MNKKPKILLLDYETSPAKGYFFGSIWETNIIEVIEYEQILSVAWKWHGEKKIHVVGQDDFKRYKPGVLNDKDLVTFFERIIATADIVVGHNADRFDNPVFNTRLLAHGFKPIPPFKSFDTKKISKNKFHLPSNKLDDIADFLGIERKLAHTGKHMWFGCEQGNASDWKMMKSYNKRDVLILDKVLDKILPFFKHNNDYTNNGMTCPNPTCGSTHMVKSKRRATVTGYKQQYQCKECGSYKTDSKVTKYEEKK